MPKSILVFDDETVVVEIAKRRLEDRGYEVQTAGDGNEAFMKLKFKIPETCKGRGKSGVMSVV